MGAARTHAHTHTHTHTHRRKTSFGKLSSGSAWLKTRRAAWSGRSRYSFMLMCLYQINPKHTNAADVLEHKFMHVLMQRTQAYKHYIYVCIYTYMYRFTHLSMLV